MKTMKTKTNFFTKFMTFCVLALFLFTNMILFSSCDNGNSPNDNTNSPTDYCKICDGVQDNNHQHDYCGKCEGIQTTPHTCPVELKAEVESIGNGTYTIANFMVDPGTTEIDEMVAAWLPNAERHISTLSDTFSDDFKTKYANLIADLQNSNTYKQDTTSGFDPLINILNNNCAPIFEEIIENIDNDLDVAYFKNEYKGLSLKAYKKCSGNYFDGNPAQETYNTKKDSLNKAWAMMHALNNKVQEFSIVEDIENNNCTNITTHMDELLLKHDIANDLGISDDDLKNFIDLTLNIPSLDAMHDYAKAKGYSKHRSSCDGLDNELTK